MYIRWQQRRRTTSKFGPWSEDDIHWAAVAVESKRINGKPTQRHIGYIGGFTESQVKIAPQRCHLWDRITDRLDQLGNQITADDRKQIEAAIAAKVPRPTPAEYKDIARDFVQSFGWKYATDKQKAALQNEADQWQDRKGDLGEKIDTAWQETQSGSSAPATICSFCGKSAAQVHSMVAGSNANICDGCIEQAAAIVAERKANNPPALVSD